MVRAARENCPFLAHFLYIATEQFAWPTWMWITPAGLIRMMLLRL